MPDWLAEAKGELAALGVDVHPDAKVTTYDKPTGGVSVVVLDRVSDVVPDYCVHGFASCVSCDHMCFLGSETVAIVQSHKTYPLCMECAIAFRDFMILKGEAPPEPSTHIQDHLREEGPHE